MNLLTRIRTFRSLQPIRQRELPDVARSIAIIMDGNGRWARRRRLPVAAGHRAGTKSLRRTVEAAIDLGVESLCVFAFSTENWSRPPEEVDALMEIFVETIERELPDLAKQGVRTRFIGRSDRAPEELQQRMAALEAETAANEADRLLRNAKRALRKARADAGKRKADGCRDSAAGRRGGRPRAGAAAAP